MNDPALPLFLRIVGWALNGVIILLGALAAVLAYQGMWVAAGCWMLCAFMVWVPPKWDPAILLKERLSRR
jgi:hypothetical protein